MKAKTSSVDEWLKPGSYIPISTESVAALVAEVMRLRAEIESLHLQMEDIQGQST